MRSMATLSTVFNQARDTSSHGTLGTIYQWKDFKAAFFMLVGMEGLWLMLFSKKRLLLLLCISVERGLSSRRSLLEGEFWKLSFGL